MSDIIIGVALWHLSPIIDIDYLAFYLLFIYLFYISGCIGSGHRSGHSEREIMGRLAGEEAGGEPRQGRAAICADWRATTSQQLYHSNYN